MKGHQHNEKYRLVFVVAYGVSTFCSNPFDVVKLRAEKSLTLQILYNHKEVLNPSKKC